jgi:ADP-ribose pyrophosphatase
MVPAASYYSLVGFTDEKMHLFLAFDLRETAQRLEQDERIRQVVLPFEEVRRRLESGGFEDSKTLIGLRELLAYLENRSAK